MSERLFLDDISTGASGDIQQATNLARAMVTQFGMSERLGPISYDSSGHSIFIGRDFGMTKSYSEETAAIIDEEVKRIFDEATAKCEHILTQHADVLRGVRGVPAAEREHGRRGLQLLLPSRRAASEEAGAEMRDASIEPPARKISYTFDEPEDTPAIEDGAKPEAGPDGGPEGGENRE